MLSENRASMNKQAAIRAKNGSDTAENMVFLWENNQGLICRMAKRYTEFAEYDDLMQECYIGLCDAVDHYEPDKGVPFINYAAYWMRACMIRFIQGSAAVRIPSYMDDLIRKDGRFCKDFREKSGQWPTDRDRCRHLHISSEQLQELKEAKRFQSMECLDKETGEDEEGSLYDVVKGSEGFEDETIDHLDNERLGNVLWPMVDNLPGMEGQVIKDVYRDKKKLSELARDKDVSYNRIRAIHDKGMRMLRRPENTKHLRPYLKEYDDIFNAAIKGNSLQRFQNTWTSATERTALQNMGGL